MRSAMLKRFLVLPFVFALFFSAAFPAAGKEKGGEEELKERIEITNKKRVTPKEIKRFEEQLKGYFFEAVPVDFIEAALRELKPGEALAAIVTVNLSKKPDKGIISMRKGGKSWTEIITAAGVKLKDVVKEVKEFQKSSGCA